MAYKGTYTGAYPGAVVVDRGNPFDPFNNRNYRDFNPQKVQYITKEIWEFYHQFPDKCPTCPIDYYTNKRYLGLDMDEPECVSICRFAVHIAGYKQTGKPVVECKTRIKGFKNDPRLIFISRAMMNWLYHHNIPMIFRACKENGCIMHHKRRNPFDDRGQEIVIIKAKTHVDHHADITRLDNILKGLKESLNVNQSNIGLQKAVAQQARMIDNMEQRITDDPIVFKLIEEYVNNAIPNLQHLAFRWE